MKLCEQEELFFMFSMHMEREAAEDMVKEVTQRIDNIPTRTIIREIPKVQFLSNNFVRYGIELLFLLGGYFLSF